MKTKKKIKDLFKNRSELDVIASMISGSVSAIKKTNLMYKSNLNYPQLKYYLAFLENRGLVKRINSPSKRSFYKATNLGLKFLKDYKRLMGYFND